MKLITRPLTDKSFVGAAPRIKSRFTATWASTLDLLECELRAIQPRGASDPILMMDITESDLRIDGQVRAAARPESNAVMLSFDSERGPLTFRCDQYDATPWENKMSLWQHNIRAIALTLEALRAVDRHGATQSGEQYAGYRQIGARSSETEAVKPLAFLTSYCGAREGEGYRELVRRARAQAHPDRGGSPELWNRVQDAAAQLGVK